MNFLAHYLLSFRQEPIIIGNFIADFLKGNQHKLQPEGIKNGILVHHVIDNYSDNHPIVRSMWAKLHANFGHYGRVINDVYLDHFLSLRWQDYSDNQLSEDIKIFYNILLSNNDKFNLKISRNVDRIIKTDWFSKYQSMSDLNEVFKSLALRAKFKNNIENSVEVLIENHEEFDKCFNAFFPQLHEHIYYFMKKHHFM